ncbi:uncharacterized protein Gasu_19910 [Galdieria sulphuraria]|uniref:Uncharacterized protein n=1 Tax=Galdieria sulphuraria TaxID=130081 RepID=M2XKU0_GALSU|nr:uncharacterized protein Gasu_19910 [Galdieria sulphuraria]EME30752.1 hypothetical protein Gasu_19910 [Galdieria sulphuraria]|eukprot:XP_005707272.1 hypothetical protein Gasu_19910 [Galdieria sulphuraria]
MFRNSFLNEEFSDWGRMDISNSQDDAPNIALTEKKEERPIIESSSVNTLAVEDVSKIRTEGVLPLRENPQVAKLEQETNLASEGDPSNGKESTKEDKDMHIKTVESEETVDKQQSEQVDYSKETTLEKSNTLEEKGEIENKTNQSSDNITAENVSKKVTRQTAASAVKTKNTSSNTESKYVPGSLEEYRHRVLHLERIYLTKVYEAERAKLYHAQVAKINYEYDCQQAEEEFELGRRLLITRLLYENADRRRRIEELKYKIVRDENNSYLRLRRHDVGHRTRSTLQPFNSDNNRNVVGGKELINGQEKEGTLFPSLQNCVTDQDAHLSQLGVSGRWNRLVRATKRSNEEKNQLRVVLDSDEMKEDLAEISATPHKGTTVNSCEGSKYKIASEGAPEERRSHTYYHVRGRKRKARGKGRVAYGKNR